MVIIFGKKKIDEFYKEISEAKRVAEEAKKEVSNLQEEIKKLKTHNSEHKKTLDEKIIELSQVVENGFEDENQKLTAQQLLNEWFNGEE